VLQPLGRELVSLTAYRLYQVESKLRADAPDADVDDVGPGIEIVAPDRGQQLAFGDGLTDMLH
jgi:hypothetical protein